MPPESAFDANAFMGTSYSDAAETHYTPIPESDYLAIIGSDENDLVVRSGRSDKGPWARLDVNWYIDDEELERQLSMDRIRVRQSIWLDIEGDPPHLVWGTNRNIKLGKVREAVGQNTGGDWNIAMLRGAGPALVHVVQDPSEDDPEVIYNNVVRVTAA